ncbi:AI-2E family transporter [Ureibacillus sp. NPDC094379]
MKTQKIEVNNLKTSKIGGFSVKSLMKYLILTLYFLVLWMVLPISLAIFFAYLLFPVVDFCHKRLKLPYILSAITISILIFLITYSFFYITLQSIISIYPEVTEQVKELQKVINHSNLIVFDSIFNKSISLIDSAILGIGNFLQDVIQYLIEMFIFIVAFYFSLFESKKNRYWFFIYVPKKYRQEWRNYFTKGTSLLSYFIFVEFQLFIITFFILSCGLALLQFEHPINKAFLISLADSLPFFGIGLFLIPISIYFFAVGESFISVSILILYIFILITRQIVESMLWASTFHIRTVHTFFISAASILLFGIYGIIISPFLILIVVKLKQKSTY